MYNCHIDNRAVIPGVLSNATTANNKKDRKLTILEAALTIISDEGLRGLTYRAVAKHAGVPLGSTTYYFSSIEEIYVGAYKLFQEKTQENIQLLNSTTAKLLLDFHKSELPAAQKKEELIDTLSSLMVEYIAKLVTRELNYRKIEAAFMHAAIINPTIKELLWNRQLEFLQLSEQWFHDFGLTEPGFAAELYVGTVNQLERKYILHPETDFDADYVNRTFHFFFRKLLNSG